MPGFTGWIAFSCISAYMNAAYLPTCNQLTCSWTPLRTPIHIPVCCCSVPGDCPQGVVDLWRRCIARDPSDRPSSAEVLVALEAIHSVKPLKQI